MDRSDLACRMKEYEKVSDGKLTKRTPVAIRLDMRAGHTFTRGFERPFDKVFMRSMQRTMQYLCENIENAIFGYSQSDEITIILVDYKTLDTQCFFDNRLQKICSISASMATMAFNRFFKQEFDNWGESTFGDSWFEGGTNEPLDEEDLRLSKVYGAAWNKGAMFDARCFNIPKEEVTNLVYWRQLDATRNSIQMVGQANFSHKELQNKTCNMIQDMLHEQKSINWNDYPAACKRGTACRRVEKEVNIAGTMDTISCWEIDYDMPILKGEDRDYLDKLVYVGE